VYYQELNKGTVKNECPIPLVDDLLGELLGSTIFFKIDMKRREEHIRREEKNGRCALTQRRIEKGN